MAKKEQNKFARLIWSVIEEDIFKDELVLDFHSFVFTFLPGDTILFPRNQLTSLLPYFDLQEELPIDIARLKIEEAISIIRPIGKISTPLPQKTWIPLNKW